MCLGLRLLKGCESASELGLKAENSIDVSLGLESKLRLPSDERRLMSMLLSPGQTANV